MKTFNYKLNSSFAGTVSLVYLLLTLIYLSIQLLHFISLIFFLKFD